MGKANNHKALGVFSLALITAGSVDSIRNLPATALFGGTLIFFFLLAVLFFLLPSALISAELASTSKEHGGVYAWVKQAFGAPVGFLAVWFQWIENVIWYPTILSFVAGTIGYLISPTLIHSRWFLISVILVAFWGTTLVNLFGIKSSAWFNNIAMTFGLLLPMTLIIALGVVWIAVGNPLQIHFTAATMVPHLGNSHVWVALVGIILSFCGMEIATVHGQDVRDPQRSFPRAMLIATAIIVVTLLAGALSIAIVVPEQSINLIAGIMQAFDAFFSTYHLRWLLPVIALMLVAGGLGGVNNWIIAPTRGLWIAANEGHMPAYLRKSNKFGAPNVLLISQAVIVSLVCSVFLLFPTVNASYWLLTALATQLYMLMYILMFLAAIRLRYLKVKRERGFMIWGGKWGMNIVAGMGLIGAGVAFSIGFIPPAQIDTGSAWYYELLLLGGLITMSAPPFLFIRQSRRNSVK